MLRVVLSFAVCLINNILLGDESCVYLFNLPQWASSNRHSLAANNAVPAFWADRRKGKAKMLAALKNNVTGNYDKCCLSHPRATTRSLQSKSASCVKSATGSKLSEKESMEPGRERPPLRVLILINCARLLKIHSGPVS
jgi:hypothetical protein